MVRLCFALLLLHKEQDGIHMPRRLVDDLEGEISDKKLHKCALGNDILTADLNGEDALLLNICEHRVFGVAHNVSRLIRSERVGKVAKPRFNMVSECFLALVRNGDVALGYSHGTAVTFPMISATNGHVNTSLIWKLPRIRIRMKKNSFQNPIQASLLLKQQRRNPKRKSLSQKKQKLRLQCHQLTKDSLICSLYLEVRLHNG